MTFARFAVATALLAVGFFYGGILAASPAPRSNYFSPQVALEAEQRLAQGEEGPR